MNVKKLNIIMDFNIYNRLFRMIPIKISKTKIIYIKNNIVSKIIFKIIIFFLIFFFR